MIHPIIVSFSRKLKLVHSTIGEAFWDGGFRLGRPCPMLAPEEGGWSQDAVEHGILLDLSSVQWCDLTACVHLLLVLERALKDSLPYVGLAMPDPRPTSSELAQKEEWTRSGQSTRLPGLLDQQRRRSDALKFLEKIGFREAARCLHLPEQARGRLLILDDFGSNMPAWAQGLAEQMDARQKHDPTPPPFVYDLHQPDTEPLHPHTFLRWIPVNIGADTMRAEAETLSEKAGKVMSQSHKDRTVLKNFDADTLVHVIFHELFQNVQMHAGLGVTHCLVGIWARKTGQLVVADDYVADDRRFYEQWVKKHSFPLVDVAVGDSGVGILQTLRPAIEKENGRLEGVPTEIASQPDYADRRLLFWSMARWSSSASENEPAKRGTRGLYRVKRLARSYQALLTIRSGTVLAGWDWGGLDQPRAVHSQGRSWVPGTLVQMRFVSQDHGTKPTVSTSSQPANMEYLFGHPLNLAGHVQSSDWGHLRDLLSRRDPGGRHRCVIVPIGSLPHETERRKTALAQLLDALRPMANPGALVLLAMGLSPKELSIHVDSFNQQLTEDEEQLRWAVKTEHPSNPFWVLDRDLRVHWAGVCAWELPLLRQILPMSAEFWANDGPLTQPVDAAAIKTREDRALSDYRQHADQFVITEDRSPAARFTPGDISREVIEKCALRLHDSLTQDPRRLNKGHVKDGLFLSPSLQLTQGWIDVAKTIKEFSVFQTVPSALSALHHLEFAGFAPKQWQQWLGDLAYLKNDQFELTEEITTSIPPAILRQDSQQKRLGQILDCLEIHMGTPFITHALAIKVRQFFVESGGDGLPGFVLREPGSMDEVSGGLRRLLGLPKRLIELPDVGPLRAAEELWEIIENQRVLIFADSLLSGSGVMRIISQVVKEHARPVAVACVLDLRPEGENGRPLLDAGLEIPVISLASIHSLVKQRDPLKWNPLWHAVPPSGMSFHWNERHNAPPGFHPFVHEEELFRLMVRSQSLRFGHFILPPHRHFLFLVDAPRFLAFNETLAITRQAVAKEWEMFQSRLPGQLASKQPVILLEAPGYTLEAGLEIFGPEAAGRIHVIRKSRNNSLRQLPNLANRPVLLMLWSSITGHSAQQFVYQLANAGAGAVLAVTWLCRMPPLQEEVMRGWTELTVPQQHPQEQLADESQTAGQSMDYRSLPVQFRFLSRGGIPAFGGHDCPICRQRERIGTELKRYPSPHLRSFADSYVEATRPEDMSFMSDDVDEAVSFWSKVPSDLPPLMLRLRTRFERMRSDTRERLEVRAEISHMLAETEKRNAAVITQSCAFICLVAIETDWLKEPPLSFPRVRAEISALCKRLLLDGCLDEQNEVMMRHAIVTLRSASKTEFALLTPKIFQTYSTKKTVLEQLLYDCFSYLDQRYHRTVHYLQPMTDSLEQVCEELRAKRAGGPDDSEIESTVLTLSALSYEYLAREAQNPTPEQAWLALLQFLENQLEDNHHAFGLCGKSLRYRPPAQEDGTLGSPRFWGGVRLKWRTARELIQRNVVPRLSVILPFLNAPYAENHFKGSPQGVDRLSFLRGMAEEGGGPDLRAMDETLDRFCLQSPAAESGEWKRYEHFRRLIRETILEPLGRTMVEGGAVLWRFLDGCPCYLGDIITEAVDSLEWLDSAADHQIIFEPTIKDLEIAVFCHRDIIIDLISETLHNALQKHRRKRLPDPARVQIEIGLDIQTSASSGTNNFVILVIRNYGSILGSNAGEKGGGQGLQRVDRSLRAFGGGLNHGPPPPQGSDTRPWDYQVTACLGKETSIKHPR